MVDINVRPLSKALWVLASAGKWRIRDIHKLEDKMPLCQVQIGRETDN